MLVGYIFPLVAQDVNLEVAGKREIEPFYRITKQPKLIDSVIPTSEIQYPLLSLKYRTSFALDTIKTAKIKLVDKLSELNKGYARIGIGSALMPLVDVYYNSERSRKSVYGIHAKHLSSFAKIKGYAPAQFDRTSLNLFGKINETKYSADANVHFSSMGLHNYGIKNENIRKDSIAQRFTDAGFSANFREHKKDSLLINYLLGLDFNHFQEKDLSDTLAGWYGRENYVAARGSIWYKFGKETIYIDPSLSYNAFTYGKKGQKLTPIDSGFVQNNLVFNLNPYVTTFAKNNRLKIRFGASVTLDAMNNNIQPKSNVYIYPDVEAKYSLFNDILIPYLQVNGGLKQRTFKSFAAENEFLLSNNLIANENNVLTGKVGIKGAFSNAILFNISGSYGFTKNKALFITDTLRSIGNRFAIIYDNVTTFKIEASVIYQLQEKVKVEAIGILNSYETKYNTFAWNLPQLQAIARGFYQLTPQLSLNLDATIEGGRQALVYSLKDSDHFENLQYSKKLGLIADLNLGAEYRYNQKVSAFLQVNNFAAQRYKRWYNYPVQGFQVLGGVTFKF